MSTPLLPVEILAHIVKCVAEPDTSNINGYGDSGKSSKKSLLQLVRTSTALRTFAHSHLYDRFTLNLPRELQLFLDEGTDYYNCLTDSPERSVLIRSLTINLDRERDFYEHDDWNDRQISSVCSVLNRFLLSMPNIDELVIGNVSVDELERLIGVFTTSDLRLKIKRLRTETVQVYHTFWVPLLDALRNLSFLSIESDWRDEDEDDDDVCLSPNVPTLQSLCITTVANQNVLNWVTTSWNCQLRTLDLILGVVALDLNAFTSCHTITLRNLSPLSNMMEITTMTISNLPDSLRILHLVQDDETTWSEPTLGPSMINLGLLELSHTHLEQLNLSYLNVHPLDILHFVCSRCCPSLRRVTYGRGLDGQEGFGLDTLEDDAVMFRILEEYGVVSTMVPRLKHL